MRKSSNIARSVLLVAVSIIAGWAVVHFLGF